MDDKKIFDLHAKYTGKLVVSSAVPIDSKEILSQVYTPGVGKVCMAIKDDETQAKKYTIAGKTIAVISDGTAVLGFGDIGPKAAMPVMEGKCAIFKEFAGVEAFPICIDEKDTEKLISIIKAISVNFAAINLEDISAPRCFEIEQRLINELDIPVMHDDQHGTAIVTLAGLKGAIELTKKKNVKIVLVGAGAAGTATTKILLNTKVKSDLNIESIKVVDSEGVVSTDRKNLNSHKLELAKLTDQNKFEILDEALKGADVFIGVSVAGLLTQEKIKLMAKDPIIFAMANPVPEIMPDEAKQAGASIIATGRSDFANQINNALAYPGVFKGLLNSGAEQATEEIKITAAYAISDYHKKELSEENLLPSILDKKIPEIIAEAITKLIKN